MHPVGSCERRPVSHLRLCRAVDLDRSGTMAEGDGLGRGVASAKAVAAGVGLAAAAGVAAAVAAAKTSSEVDSSVPATAEGLATPPAQPVVVETDAVDDPLRFDRLGTAGEQRSLAYEPPVTDGEDAARAGGFPEGKS